MPTRELKIARITGRLAVGGPSRQVCLLHQKLRPGFDTVLIAGQPDRGEADMSYLLHSQEGVRWIRSMSRPVRPWADARAFFQIWRILRQEEPDIVHTHSAKAGALGRVAAWLAGVPVRIHTYHGHVFEGYFHPLKSRLYRFLERQLNRITTRVITVSTGQAAELTEKHKVVAPEKMTVIRNGFDLAPFADSRQRAPTRLALSISPEQIVVLWAARMAPVKGVDLLVEIIRRAREVPALFFLVVGDGIERPKLEVLVGECFNFRVIGWRSDMPQLWSAADIALLTSRNEGTPTALIEGMAAGKPFVATRVGGVADLAVPPIEEAPQGYWKAQNGFLTPPDSVTMVECLKLLCDPKLRFSMGHAGQAFVNREYGQDRLLKEMAELYRREVEKQSSRA